MLVRRGGRLLAPDRAAEAEIEAARVDGIEQAELLDGGEGLPVAELDPAEPSLMVLVAPATSAMDTAGDTPSTPGFR